MGSSAFFEIISQLVTAVPGHVWREQRYFPFGSHHNPQGHVFDVLFFSQYPQGALGIAWIEFRGVDEILTFPFRLARHSEDGDLISLVPWSLREASADSEFYRAWKTAVHGRTRLFTERGALFEEKQRAGRPGLQALRVLDDEDAVYVRVESQEAFRIFRSFSVAGPASIEVEMLDYLTNQKIFHNFPELISVFEYRLESGRSVSVAHVTRYVRNNGTLWQNLVPMLQAARFPIVGNEDEASLMWKQALVIVEKLGRLLAEFHRAMTYARDSQSLQPESNSGESAREWLAGFWQSIRENIAKLMDAQFIYPRFKATINRLRDCSEELYARVGEFDNLGLRIRTHGRPHLGHILVTRETLFLFDFGDKGVFPSLSSWKHSCLRDLAVMVLSLRYAWHMSEYRNTNPVVEELFGEHSRQLAATFSARPAAVRQEYVPSLLEERLVKFYLNVLREDPGSTALLPPSPQGFSALYNFLLFHRCIVETARDFDSGNPRIKTSLRILEDLCETLFAVER